MVHTYNLRLESKSELSLPTRIQAVKPVKRKTGQAYTIWLQAGLISCLPKAYLLVMEYLAKV